MTTQDEPPEVDMNALLRARARNPWDPFAITTPEPDPETTDPKDAA